MQQSESSTRKDPAGCPPSPHPAVPEFGGFGADYHHCLGQSLAEFPRRLPLPAAVSSKNEEDITCWPDFATFIEDGSGRQMMYYPANPSPWSVCVLFDSESRSWHTQLYFDADRIL